MISIKARGLSAPGLLLLLLWAGNAQAVPCQNNISASNPDSVYTDHGDGTVTDTRTGLMWKQCVEGLSGATCEIGPPLWFTWTNALAHTEASTFANYTDWRLPNVKELSSLVEECRVNPSINTNRFPNTPSAALWSSSPVGRYSDFAWTERFDYGGAGFVFRSQDRFARLVRGGH